MIAFRALAILFVALAVVLQTARPTHGHASLVGSEPADGAVVARPPSKIALRFNEAVAPLVIRLVGPRGEVVEIKAFAVHGQAVEITPPGELVEGTHLLSWRVISADGHPVGGSVVFFVGKPSLDSPVVPSAEGETLVRVGVWLTRLLLYIGLFVGVGGAFFIAWIASAQPPPVPAGFIITAALVLGLFSAALSIGLQGLDARAAPVGALTTTAVWFQGLETAYGPTAIIAVAALTCGLLALAVPGRWQARSLSTLGLIGTGCALAVSGHASTAEPQWLARASVFLHVIGLVFWIGALSPLMMVVQSKSTFSEATHIVGRFSAAMLLVLPIILLAGAVLAVVQLGAIEALWTTLYGRILALKLVAVVALLVFAAINRLVLTPALTRAESQEARRWFAPSIGAETVLVITIVGLVAGWRLTPPPRSQIASGRAEPAYVHIHAIQGMADVTLEPGRIGSNRAIIILLTASGTILEPKEVMISVANPVLGIEPLERIARRVDDGDWRVENLPIPRPGRWRVRLDVLVSDFEKLVLEGDIELKP